MPRHIFWSDIKLQLEPYKDRVFYHGLTETGISDIEKEIGSSIPAYFREFLKIFGVRQDFVFGLLRRERDFIENTNYLPADVKKSYIVIGDNGGEDYWLLNAIDHNDSNIYGWQHWADGAIVKLGLDFETLLKDNISKLSSPGVVLPANDKKNWEVQFAIPTNNEQLIYSTIPLVRMQDWELKEISPAEVHCYETKAKLVDNFINFRKQEYNGWSSPIYYFNLSEHANNFGKESLINDIDAKLKKAFPKYKLIDYGILVLTDETK
jgi:hypothetical protein